MPLGGCRTFKPVCIMAAKKNSVLPASVKNFGSRLPFGLFGTLALVAAVSFFSPLVAGVAATALAAGFVAREVIPSSWNKGGRWLKNFFGGSQSTVQLPGGGTKTVSIRDGQATGNAMVDALVGQLRKSGMKVSTDWEAGKKVLAALPDSYELFKKPDAKVYGFVYQGNIFINPEETGVDVPIHEYTHLWAEGLRQQNADEWKHIVSMMKQDTVLWNDVKSTYTHLTTDDEIADEVLATFSGRHGAQRLAEHCQHGEAPEQAFQGVLDALERFWKHVAQFFNVHYTTREDIADRVLSDFLHGVNPHQFIDEDKITLSDRTPLASQELVHQEENSQPTIQSPMNKVPSQQEALDRLHALLGEVLPENGRIELPRPFGIDQLIGVGTYDMAAKYIIRDDASYRFSDGEVTLPLSRLMGHQVGDLTRVLEQYREQHAVLRDMPRSSLDASILDIRRLVAAHAGKLDADVFLQKPVDIGHDMQIVGVSVALSNTRDDAVILKHLFRDQLHYNDYRYYDEDWQHGIKVFETIDSDQAAAVLGELKRMEQAHTLIPVSVGYSDSGHRMSAFVNDVTVDDGLAEQLRSIPAVAGVDHINGIVVGTEKLARGSFADGVAFNNALHTMSQALMSRHLVVQEDDAYVVTLDPNSRANLDKNEETVKDVGGNSLKAVELIAQHYDTSASLDFRMNDALVKVRFSSEDAANRFVSGYFDREDMAKAAVRSRTENGVWQPGMTDFVNAWLVENGGISKGLRECEVDRLFQQADIDYGGDISITKVDDAKEEVIDMARNIPTVMYRGDEARIKFNDIQKGSVSSDISDYFPVFLGATGYFEDKLADGGKCFTAYNNSSGDLWTETFKTEQAAVLYCRGTMSADKLHQMEESIDSHYAAVASSPMLTDDIIISKDSVSKSLASQLPFDHDGELEIRMRFFDGYAEEVPHRNGRDLPDDERLKLTYPTLFEVANDPDMQDKIEHLTNRYWEDGSNAEKVYDIALKYGEVSRLYEISQSVDARNADVERIAQDALFERITDIGAKAFTGEQKQALLNYQQSFGTDADKSFHLSERLLRGIDERLKDAGVPDTWVNDAQHELTEFFQGKERDESRGRGR